MDYKTLRRTLQLSTNRPELNTVYKDSKGYYYACDGYAIVRSKTLNSTGRITTKYRSTTSDRYPSVMAAAIPRTGHEFNVNRTQLIYAIQLCQVFGNWIYIDIVDNGMMLVGCNERTDTGTVETVLDYDATNTTFMTYRVALDSRYMLPLLKSWTNKYVTLAVGRGIHTPVVLIGDDGDLIAIMQTDGQNKDIIDHDKAYLMYPLEQDVKRNKVTLRTLKKRAIKKYTEYVHRDDCNATVFMDVEYLKETETTKLYLTTGSKTI